MEKAYQLMSYQAPTLGGQLGHQDYSTPHPRASHLGHSDTDFHAAAAPPDEVDTLPACRRPAERSSYQATWSRENVRY